MGDVVAAVDHYTDMAPEIRSALKQRMALRQYDDIVSIRRDTIAGKYDYDSAIRDMHFGAGGRCTTVTRTKWRDTHEERGLVYCEKDQCIIVPTVCRNVSRIKRRAPSKPAAIPAMITAPAIADTLLAPTLADALPGNPPADALFGNPTAPGQQLLANYFNDPGTNPGWTRQDTILGTTYRGGGGSTGAVLPAMVNTPGTDDVIFISSVPEAPVWAMLLAGLAALMLVRAGKKRNAAS